MNNQQNECCKYREETRKKLAAKRKKIKENSKLKNNESTCEEYPKRKLKKTFKSQTPKYDSRNDNCLSKIEPPISVREKYFNPHHVLCFFEGMQNDSSKKLNGINYTTAESTPCKGMIKKSNRKTVKDKLANSDDPWCGPLVKKKSSKSMDHECDSVCSSDSVIDLEGLTLTLEERKKIAKNRLSVHPPTKNKEKERNELNASESKEKELNEYLEEDQSNTQDKTENEEPEVPAENDIEEQ